MSLQPDSPGTRKSAFAPFAFPETRILILGTLPGEASLKAARYYAHPQNQFWRLVGAAIGRENLASSDYEARVATLREANIGLWDVLASAIRSGSLDAAIREAEHAPPVSYTHLTLPTKRIV